jgi:hypothetical protein
MLRTDGSLDEPTFERAEQLCARDISEEKALVSLKVLGPKELVLAVRERSRRRCVSCFTWTSGEWSLDPSTQPPKGSEAFRVDIINIVCRGLASYPVSDALLQRVSAIFPRYPLATEAFEDTLARLVISSEIRGNLEGLDPNATVWTQIGAKGGASSPKGSSPRYWCSTEPGPSSSRTKRTERLPLLPPRKTKRRPRRPDPASRY